jgi:hypothetical protein
MTITGWQYVARDMGAERLFRGIVLAAIASVVLGVGSARTAAAQTSVWDGVFTLAQAARGEQTFERACTACHDTGEFSGARFRLSWVGQSAGDLFDTISTLMPEGDPGSLSPGEYAALVAFLFRLNGYPSGEVSLPADPRVLGMVQIKESNQQ